MRAIHLLSPLALLLAASPPILADTGEYVGAGAGNGFCDAGPDRAGAGVVCDLACRARCVVTATDDVLRSGVLMRVCDFDGETDVRCTDVVESGHVHESRTGIVDVFIVAGTAGKVTTTDVA